MARRVPLLWAAKLLPYRRRQCRLGNDESLPWRDAGLDSKCVAGHSVASALAEGGLGVRSLADYVRVFSMKLWWRFRGKSSLWSEYLHGRYCRNLHPTVVPYNRNHSPVWHRLCRIRDVVEPFLFWTLGEEETVSHLFIESAAVQDVWQQFVAIFGLCLCDTGSLTHMVHFWRYSTPFHSDLHIQTLIPFLILWFTWTLRNAAKQFLEPPKYVCWCAPSPSWFKLNTDGYSLGNPGLAGAAGIIRDSAGYVHLAYQFALGTGTSVLAELTAVWRGMELALTHGLGPLVVEVDTTAISLLKSRAFGMWEVQHLIMRIVRLKQLLVADVQHVFREANGAADHLAKEAASLQLTRVLHHDDITGVLRGILCFDIQEAPHLRRG
ncbi:UNVERIFIED_CONTAM: putative ribonuclease H protein [Sesamum calycinum]|uniref:Ribonuclease H protein n=1 Tax=Sesamum calycinum TaxID=2727403 RepID=A0AAW2LZL4_9LAMI